MLTVATTAKLMNRLVPHSDPSSVYNCWASVAEPLRDPSASIRTTSIRFPRTSVSTSPAPTKRPGLQILLAFTRTNPSDTARAQLLRVLKNRACQSHLSSRIFDILLLTLFLSLEILQCHYKWIVRIKFLSVDRRRHSLGLLALAGTSSLFRIRFQTVTRY